MALILVAVPGVVAVTLFLVVEVFLIATLFRVRRRTVPTNTQDDQHKKSFAVPEIRVEEYIRAADVRSIQAIGNTDEQQMYADVERLGSLCLLFM